MRPFRSLTTLLGSHRFYLGFLLGIAACLLFSLPFGGQGMYTLEISMLVAMWVSGTWQPKRAALLGLLIGHPTGIFHSIQYLAQDGVLEGGLLLRVITVFVNMSVGSLVSIASCVLIGLIYAAIAGLYRRKAVF